jgi:cyclopropane fatty-acyl-phospholipid synthase-like methyltransferase
VTIDLPPLFDHLAFLSPLSGARADQLVSWLATGLADGGTVLDVGCGWGELPLRVAAAAPPARVIGIDLDEQRIAEACRRAVERGLEERATFLVADGVAAGPSPVEGLVAIGATQVWGPDVAEGHPLDYGSALAAMRARVVRGGRVVYADAIWSRSPTPEATAPLSGRDDEFVRLDQLVELAVGQGFAVAGVREATLDEWDEFESGYTAGYATWLAEHDPAHPDAAEVRERAARQRNGYLRGYRGVLGMAYLQLIAV